jgi:aminoglycoside phosphotransferase
MPSPATLRPRMCKSLSGNKVWEIYEQQERRFRKCYQQSAGFAVEASALRLLEGRDVPVPSIVAEQRGKRSMCLILSAVSGASLAKSTWQGNERIAIARRLGQTIALLQQSTRGRRSEAIAIPERNRTYIEKKLGHLKVAVRGALEKVLLTSPWLGVSESDLVLVHRDLRYSNLIWNAATGTIGLIDFEVAIWGGREGDFGRLLTTEIPLGVAREELVLGFTESGGGEIAKERLAFSGLLFCVEMLAWLEGRREKTREEFLLERRLTEQLPSMLKELS